ncbi:hypothetical protein [Flavivirga algicola]|uniref:Alpha-galactosidase n=1 Tax=Flavivirga algicola TaxID=2729136 RepID=A0ABX1RWK4_9FLAO|nr:hypothetical protein [Flavivirga algicola]NMH87960.1 hypothetical protein [Flavivirga algicola]
MYSIKINLKSLIVFILLMFFYGLIGFQKISADTKKDVFYTLGRAKVIFKNNELYVETGEVKRKWRWTGFGFITTSYKNTVSGKEWAESNHTFTCDWDLPTKITSATKAELVSLEVLESNDEKFTSPHLLVTAYIHYQIGIDLKFLIRVYPDSPGIWTALEVKSDNTFSTEGIPEDLAYKKSYGSNQPVKIARNEFIPVDFSKKNQRKYWGIYNNPGNRVNTENMVKERIVTGYPIFQDEENTWANGVVIQKDNEGLIVLKESNKTVNKYGIQTGAFYCTPTGIEVTGWGLKPNEISSEFKRTWATWSILYAGGDAASQLALKRFDRIRYPVNLDLDMHILIDTWGSDWQKGNFDKIYGRENSEFSIIEKEIKSASDLGIDIVRIDDGWQDGRTKSKDSWHPNTKVGYDANWIKIKKLSEEYNVGIGLWAAALFITPEELLDNQKKLDVATWKFDFDKLENHDAFANRLKKSRDFIKETDYSTQISWCPEYDDQRYGWYSPVREVGPMYFQNIQNNLPNHLVYVPYITLRHHWMISKYYNMNDLQTHWQNTSRTNPRFSDAHLHSQSYAAMSAFMAAPSCFMLTQLLQTKERDELRQLISIYKEHRKDIFQSYVFPIGEEPNNHSWSGFQIYNPDKNTGFLMIFRELHNNENSKEIKLKFLKNKKIKLIDLEENNTIKQVRAGLNGNVRFFIDKPAQYLFLKYEL